MNETVYWIEYYEPEDPDKEWLTFRSKPETSFIEAHAKMSEYMERFPQAKFRIVQVMHTRTVLLSMEDED